MDVDIHLFRRNFQKERGQRVFAADEPPLVGFAHGREKALVGYGAPVDVEQDAVRPLLAHACGRGKAVAADAVAFRINGQEFPHDAAGPDDAEAPAQVLAGEKAEHLPLARAQGKGGLCPGQGQTREPVLGAAELGGGTFEKFEPRRDVGEEVPHLHQGAPGERGRA